MVTDRLWSQTRLCQSFESKVIRSTKVLGFHFGSPNLNHSFLLLYSTQSLRKIKMLTRSYLGESALISQRMHDLNNQTSDITVSLMNSNSGNATLDIKSLPFKRCLSYGYSFYLIVLMNRWILHFDSVSSLFQFVGCFLIYNHVSVSLLNSMHYYVFLLYCRTQYVKNHGKYAVFVVLQTHHYKMNRRRWLHGIQHFTRGDGRSIDAYIWTNFFSIS